MKMKLLTDWCMACIASSALEGSLKVMNPYPFDFFTPRSSSRSRTMNAKFRQKYITLENTG